jgi:hypothetical protein
MDNLYPKLEVWLSTLRLIEEERRKNPSIPEPPQFLILAGWWGSVGIQKYLRWQEIKQWANLNGLNHLMPSVDLED